jgi:hypothetical protein
MHSLAQLNSYSLTSLEYTDDRPIGITYTTASAVNKSITIDESQTHSAQLGTDIKEFINVGSANVIYRIDVSNLANATVSWGSLPTGITSNVAAGVYNIIGLNTVKNWNLIKSPTITLPTVDYSGVWTYTSSIYLNGNVSRAWTTTVTVNDVPEISTPTPFYYTNSTTSKILYAPQILDTTGTSYSIVCTPSNVAIVSNLTSTGTGGTISSNVTTKALTISGTRTQVNSHLSNLSLTSTGLDIDWTLNYSLTNNPSGFVSNISQQILNNSTAILDRGAPSYYSEDITSVVATTPTITDIYNANVSQQYQMVVNPTITSSVANLTTSGTTANISWNNTSKSLTIIGTKTQVNGALGNLTLTPAIDYVSNFYLNYNLTTAGNTYIRSQLLIIDQTNEEISNIAVSRSFVQNTPDYLFTSSIPQIIESPSGNPIYTLNFSSDAGEFGLSDADINYNYSFSGTKSECNAFFSQLKFYPDRDLYGSQSFTYKQYRTGVLQLTQLVSMNGTIRTTPLPDQGIYTITESTYLTPTVTQSKYLNIKLTLVGGGGGSGWGTWAYVNGGGGGFMREVTIENYLLTPNQSYEIIVGLGGVGGNKPGSAPAAIIGGVGGTTSAFGFSAAGGNTGTYGNSGYNDTVYVRGAGGTYPANQTYRHVGGGGAGAGGNGSDREVGPPLVPPDPILLLGSRAGAGGPGRASFINGIVYGGGGGGNEGDNYISPGNGGTGGGGRGYVGTYTNFNRAGTPGTNGLGGGAGGLQWIGYNGGSGIVIIEFYR